MKPETTSLRDKIARAQAALSNGELKAYEAKQTGDGVSSMAVASWGPAMRV